MRVCVWGGEGANLASRNIEFVFGTFQDMNEHGTGPPRSRSES